MQDLTILTTVATKHPYPVIQNRAKEALKNFSFDNDQQVWDIEFIAFWMMVLDEYDYAYKLAQIITTNHDKVLWDSYREMLTVEYHTLMNDGKMDEAAQRKKMIEEMFQYPEKQKRIQLRIYQRYLAGVLLYDQEIKKAQDSKVLSEEIWLRFRQYYVLLFMQILGGSQEYPLEKITAEIAKEKQFLKEHIAQAKY